jgi:hypothetical protein
MPTWTALLLTACAPAPSVVSTPAPIDTTTLTADPPAPPESPPTDSAPPEPPVTAGVVETFRTLGLGLAPLPVSYGTARLTDGPLDGNGHQLIVPVGPADHTRLLALGFRALRSCGGRPGLYDLAGVRLSCFPDDVASHGVSPVATRNLDDGATLVGLREITSDPSLLHLYRIGADDVIEAVGTLAPAGSPHLLGLWFDPPPSLRGWGLFAATRSDTRADLYHLVLQPDGRETTASISPSMTVAADDVPYQLSGVPAPDGSQTALLLADPPLGSLPAEWSEVLRLDERGAAVALSPFNVDSAIFQSSPGEPAVAPLTLAPFRPMGFLTFCSSIATAPLPFAFGPWVVPTEDLPPGCYLAISNARDPTPIFRWPDFPTPPPDGALVDVSNFAGVDGMLRTPRSTQPGFSDAYLRAWGGLTLAVVTQPADQPRHTVILGIAGGDDGGSARDGLTELSEHGVTFYFQAGVSGPHPRRINADATSVLRLDPYETSRPDDHVDAGRFYPAYALYETDELGPDLRLPNPRTLTPVMADGRLLIGVAHANVARPSDARAYTWTSTGRCAMWIVQPTTPGAAYDLVHLRDRDGDPLEIPMAFTAHLSVSLSVDPTSSGSYLALCDGVTLDDDRPAVQIAP